jgi:prepilin-type processing-associated H-X9-DG protein
MQCSNNLKQLGIATHNYHDTYNALPHGNGGPYGKVTTEKHRWGIFVPLLPFLEMASLYDQIISVDVQALMSSGNWHQVSGLHSTTSPLTKNITALYCPSDAAGGTQATNRPGMTNYLYCKGDNPVTLGGYLSEVKGLRGPFGPRTYFNFAALADGTSNTLLFSEHCLAMRGVDGASNKIKIALLTSGTAATVGFNAAAGTNPAYLNKRSICLATANGDEYKTISGATKEVYVGAVFHIGLSFQNCFTTTLPPNSPSCYFNGDGYNAITTPSSYHSGGVNVTLGDGSVRFVSETIDAGSSTNETFSDIATAPIGEVSGKSPFGIWGGLGSRDGGESTSLP